MREKIKGCILLVLLGLVIFFSHTLNRAVMQNQVEPGTVDVFLDPGHGGRDPGKVGVNGVLEKDINLEISKELADCLEQDGVAVAMTRDTDEGLYPEDAQNKKRADMEKRVEMINQASPRLVVSIHQNSYQQEEVRGLQIFYYSGSEESEKTALTLEQFLQEKGVENVRSSKANDTYYMLKKTEVPTIIIECGFLSNYQDAENLTDENWQKELAEILSAGIQERLEAEN